MENEKIEIGDMVRLKSGGPVMVVEGIVGDKSSPVQLKTISQYAGYTDGDLYCIWMHEGGRKEHSFFKKETVLKVDWSEVI